MKGYTVAEYSDLTGISRQAVYKRIARGKLRTVKDGAITLISEDELEKELQNGSEPGSAPGSAPAENSDLVVQLKERLAEKDQLIDQLRAEIERNRQDYLDMLRTKDDQIRQADERLREAHIIANANLQLTDGRRPGLLQRLFGRKTETTTE